MIEAFSSRMSQKPALLSTLKICEGVYDKKLRAAHQIEGRLTESVGSPSLLYIPRLADVS